MRQAGRADAARGVAPEELLDHAVFQRMEAHRRQTAAGTQHAVGLVETAGQRLQLVVDDDAQSLEDAARRVAGAEPSRRGDVALDDLDQLAGGGEGLLLARQHDAASDALGVPLLPVTGEDVGELGLRKRVDEIGGRDVELRVHAHVERGVVGVAEAALAAVELHRGDAEVHVDDVGRGVVARGQHLGEVAVIELALAGGGAGDVAEVLGHAGIAVHGDEPALRAEQRRHGLGVAAGAEGAVDRHLALRRPQQLEQLVEKDRGVG